LAAKMHKKTHHCMAVIYRAPIGATNLSRAVEILCVSLWLKKHMPHRHTFECSYNH